MDRSSYPNQVEVRQADLLNTERTKAYQILARFRDTAQTGVATGLVVSQGSANDRVNVTVGHGYAPNGELVELTAPVVGLLVTEAPGVPVLIGLMYRETTERPGATILEGVARPRSVVGSSEILALSGAAWAALPETNDADLSQDARDRFLVCAVAERPASTAGSLTVTSPSDLEVALSAPQPVNNPGIALRAISADTTLSDPTPQAGAVDLARLRYQPSTSLLGYKAPHDAASTSGAAAPFSDVGMGVPVDVSAGGLFTLASANTLDTVTVEVYPEHLLSTVAGATVDDDFAVSALYSVPAQRAGAADEQHRAQQGQTVPTPENPHGTRFEDMQSIVSVVRGALRLGRDLVGSLARAEVARTIVDPDTSIDHATNIRMTQLWSMRGVALARLTGGVPASLRLYRTNKDGFLLLSNARFRNSGANGTFERLTTNGDNPDVGAFMLEFDPSVGFDLRYQPSSAAHTWDNNSWTRLEVKHVFSTYLTTFYGLLSLGSSMLGSAADAAQPRAAVPVSNTHRVQVWAMTNAATLRGNTRVYKYAGADGDPDNQSYGYEIVSNAHWNGTLWELDDTSFPAFRLVLSLDGFSLYTRAASSPAFATSTWTSALFLPTSGDLQPNRSIVPRGDNLYNFGSAVKRWLKGWFHEVELTHPTNAMTLVNEDVLLNGTVGFAADSIRLIQTGFSAGLGALNNRNRFYRDRMVLAWAKINVVRGSPPVPTLLGDLGVASVSVVGTTHKGIATNAIQVTFQFDGSTIGRSLALCEGLVTATNGGQTDHMSYFALVTTHSPITVRVFEMQDGDPGITEAGFEGDASDIQECELTVAVFGLPAA